MFARLRSRRRLLLGLALVAALAGSAGIAVVVLSEPPGDVSNPDVEFQADEAPSTFTWAVRGSILLEFPPVAGRRQLFLLKNNAALYAISRRTGEVRWKRKLGYLAASSPAYADGTVYVTILERFRGASGGRVVAVDAATGRTKWSRKLASRSESSPLYWRGNLFFGAEDGTVYGLRASDGFVRWRYRAGGAVKAALPSTAGGCSSATTTARSTRSARRAAGSCGSRGPGARASA